MCTDARYKVLVLMCDFSLMWWGAFFSLMVMMVEHPPQNEWCSGLHIILTCHCAIHCLMLAVGWVYRALHRVSLNYVIILFVLVSGAFSLCLFVLIVTFGGILNAYTPMMSSVFPVECTTQPFQSPILHFVYAFLMCLRYTCVCLSMFTRSVHPFFSWGFAFVSQPIIRVRTIDDGLTDSEILSLYSFVWVSANQPVPVECSICCNGIEDGSGATKLESCQHLFHSGCLAVWLRLKNNCPLCRAPALHVV
jgi:hypothetical protein